jgi:hypothetical protein
MGICLGGGDEVNLYDTLKGAHLKQANKILKHADKILGGTIISIDPSSKSMGWAVYTNGELVKAGVAKGEGSIGERLQQIYEMLPNTEPDLIITELVRSSTGHIYLSWSNGTVLARYGPEDVLEISTNLWKKAIDDSYYKSDVMDAKFLGLFAIKLCREMEGKDG